MFLLDSVATPSIFDPVRDAFSGPAELILVFALAIIIAIVFLIMKKR